MAAASQQNEDLSMEEILQSIRKIISDDDTEKTPTKSDETDMAADKSDEDIEVTGSDVLELTDIMEEVVEEETAAEEPAAEEAPAEALDVLAEIDDALESETPVEEPAVEEPAPAAPEPEPEPQPAAEETAPLPAMEEAVAPEDSSTLLSDDAATASAASLKKVLDTHKTTIPGFRSGTTLEDLVLESMKPMLKEWLDANLPSMVERIVEREIRKLVD